MPPKGKIKKKKRKVRRQAPPQVALACSEGLARLFTSGRSASLALTRGDAMKRLWALAKERSLQQGATITCDAEMRALFGVDALGLTDVPGALAGHLRSVRSSIRLSCEAPCAHQHMSRLPSTEPAVSPPRAGAVAACHRD
jgi:chromatin remodeling complex protein RSC6